MAERVGHGDDGTFYSENISRRLPGDVDQGRRLSISRCEQELIFAPRTGRCPGRTPAPGSRGPVLPRARPPHRRVAARPETITLSCAILPIHPTRRLDHVGVEDPVRHFLGTDMVAHQARRVEHD